MASATDQVLATPELLESILFQLPMQELLVNAQRVSNTWNHVIKSSPTLQQKLFFQSRPADSTSEISEHEFNPILIERFYRWVPDESDDLGFGCIPPPIDWNSVHFCDDCESDAIHWAKMNESSLKKQDAYARKEASWRRMLPIQPAYQIFEVKSEVRHDFGRTKSVGQVEFEDGVRLGTLYDYSQKTVMNPRSSFGVRWLHSSEEDSSADGRGKVRMYLWSSTLPSGIDSESEDGYSATEYLISQTGRDICGSLFPSLGYEELDIDFKVVSNELNDEGSRRLTERIIATSAWSPRLGG